MEVKDKFRIRLQLPIFINIMQVPELTLYAAFTILCAYIGVADSPGFTPPYMHL
jgi:hypothetical protein